MSEATWTCPRCKQDRPQTDLRCAPCAVTVAPGARFNLPLPSGPIWSSGWLVAAAEGLYFVSQKDGLETAAPAAPPAAAGPVASISFFIPKAAVIRVVHTKLVGEFVEFGEKRKLPLRLDAAGWKALDAACGAPGS